MTTATWKPLFWEPVSGTDERIMAGAVIDYLGEINAHRLLRDDILDCLYGKASANPKRLLDSAMEMAATIARQTGVADLNASIMGLHPGETRVTEVSGIPDALRQAALMYSSLSNLDKIDEQDAEDAPNQEESNKRFVTEVREIVINRRPEFSNYFNRPARFFHDGEVIKFGFLSDHAAIHYGVLHPVRQSSSVRDARARLWELARIQDLTNIKNSALILAVPRPDDATLGQKQREGAYRNAMEIEREADSQKIRLRQVYTAEEGAVQTEAMAG